MNFIEGESREAVMLLPESLDDYIDPDNPVRFLNEFVDNLDLKECGFEFPKEGICGKGRPAYHPKHMLKLYIYGYLNGIRSGRKLEKACYVNLEVIWLMQKLRPDFKTICDFRRKNRKAFTKVTSEFTRLCQSMNLFSGELIAIDGSKIKGVNSPEKNWSEGKIKNHLKRISKNIEEYLDYLEKLDDTPSDGDRIRRENTEEKLSRARKKHAELEELQTELKSSGETQSSSTDKDCRSMRKNSKTTLGYNIQTAVDSKYKLIVASEVTNKINDLGMLAPMSRKVKAELNIESADIIADKGYHSSEDMYECEKINMTPYIPAAMNSQAERKGFFGHDDFTYIEERNVYICPNSQILTAPPENPLKKSTKITYKNVRACRNCPIKKRCTEGRHRGITVSKHHETVRKTKARIKKEPEKLAARGAIVEHPFSCIKYQILPGGFIVKGLDMVSAEMALAHISYNMKRLLNIMSMKDLMRTCQALNRKLLSIIRAISDINLYNNWNIAA